MNFGNIKENLVMLLEDVDKSEKLLKRNKTSQFNRRTYVRNLFSYIEGVVRTLKQVCFTAKSINNTRKISPAEYCIFSEKSFELKENGNIKENSKFPNLINNLNFTINKINELFGANINLKKELNLRNKLVSCQKTRNRITHPKNHTEFTISDTEINECYDVCGRFNDICYESLHNIIKVSEKINNIKKKGIQS